MIKLLFIKEKYFAFFGRKEFFLPPFSNQFAI